MKFLGDFQAKPCDCQLHGAHFDYEQIKIERAAYEKEIMRLESALGFKEQKAKEYLKMGKAENKRALEAEARLTTISTNRKLSVWSGRKNWKNFKTNQRRIHERRTNKVC